MKVLAEPVEMISWFSNAGLPTPLRFKINSGDDSEGSMIIKVDNVIFKEKEKLAGETIYLFRCQSLINDIQKIYELKYELSSCKWILYKL